MNYDQYAYTRYNREVKKLPRAVKKKVLGVQDDLAKDPHLGKPLKANLRGWRTYPFSLGGNSYRIAYKIDEENNRIIFGSIGTREGFYSDLKDL